MIIGEYTFGNASYWHVEDLNGLAVNRMVLICVGSTIPPGWIKTGESNSQCFGSNMIAAYALMARTLVSLAISNARNSRRLLC